MMATKMKEQQRLKDGQLAQSDVHMARWAEMAASSSLIKSELYRKYDVKRGLRDLSGRGVLAGLTRIGEVSAISLVDGKEMPGPGKLIYRGIDIEQLVNGQLRDGRMGYEETAYLLLFGELPKADEIKIFEDDLWRKRKLPRQFTQDAILKIPSQDVMNALARCVLALYAFDKRADDLEPVNQLNQSLALVARLPVLAIYAYQAAFHELEGGSLVIHKPRYDLSTAANFLYMLRHNSKFTLEEARLLDLALVLHAEHGGGNNSSFTTHVVSSSGADIYGVIAAALAALKGPRHGGANIKVVRMLDDLKEKVKDWRDEEELSRYLSRLLSKEAFDRSGLIYGFGHAVYSLSDPRSLLLKKQAAALAKSKGLEEEFALYERIERLAPEVITRERKIYKGVSANVDFYSGFIYRMLDIPPALYTPLFAISRIIGWCAHRIEELANGGKIIRPAYKSVAPRRAYKAMDER